MRINSKQFLTGFKARKLSPMLKNIQDPLALLNEQKVLNAMQRGAEGFADQFNRKHNFKGTRWKPTKWKRKGWQSTLVVQGNLRAAWTGESSNYSFRKSARSIDFSPTVEYWAVHQYGGGRGWGPVPARPLSISTEGIKDRLRKLVYDQWSHTWSDK